MMEEFGYLFILPAWKQNSEMNINCTLWLVFDQVQTQLHFVLERRFAESEDEDF